MFFDISATTSEILPMFRRFVSLTGWEAWRKRLDDLAQQARQNPPIERLFNERYSLELEMQRLRRTVSLGRRIKMPKTNREYTLLSFIAVVTRVHDRLGIGGRRRLVGMLYDGLKAEYGLAPLQHEMHLATHLMSRGFDVTFSDIELGGGFDMLARKDDIELEVECKTVSADIGRKVHRRRLYQLSALLYPLLSSALDRRSGGYLLQITVPQRLDGNDQHLREISKAVDHALQAGISTPGPVPCAIDYRTFSFAGSPFETADPSQLDEEAVREYLEQAVGHPFGHALMVFRPPDGLVVVTIESAQADRVMHGLVEQLKRAVKGQLTGTRPALIGVRLSDVTASELVELANGDRAGQHSSLQIATNMLLDRPDWSSVHTVAYYSVGRVIASSAISGRQRTTTITESGPAYFFTNPRHESASDNSLKIF
jgi:hypothetical protein